MSSFGFQVEFIGYVFIYIVGIVTGALLKTWLVTNETKLEIEKALDSSGIRRSEFLQLVKEVQLNRSMIAKLKD